MFLKCYKIDISQLDNSTGQAFMEYLPFKEFPFDHRYKLNTLVSFCEADVWKHKWQLSNSGFVLLSLYS